MYSLATCQCKIALEQNDQVSLRGLATLLKGANDDSTPIALKELRINGTDVLFSDDDDDNELMSIQLICSNLKFSAIGSYHFHPRRIVIFLLL